MELDFPTNPDKFSDDERISFSKLDNKFVAVHDDGTEFEFDTELKQWLLADADPSKGVDELGHQTPPAGADEDPQRKRKHQDAENGSEVGGPVPWLPTLSTGARAGSSLDLELY